MKVTIRSFPRCWADDCTAPITAKRGVLCKEHRKVALGEIRAEEQAKKGRKAA